MWTVVHFIKDDTVESVPNIQYNKKEKRCAWPLSKHSVKKMIEKRAYPNQIDFQWLLARVLGHSYSKTQFFKYKNCIIYTFFFVGSLHEARQKANKAQFFTDLSSRNENNNCRKNLSSVMFKRIPSPPTCVISKKNY